MKSYRLMLLLVAAALLVFAATATAYAETDATEDPVAEAAESTTPAESATESPAEPEVEEDSPTDSVCTTKCEEPECVTNCGEPPCEVDCNKIPTCEDTPTLPECNPDEPECVGAECIDEPTCEDIPIAPEVLGECLPSPKDRTPTCANGGITDCGGGGTLPFTGPGDTALAILLAMIAASGGAMLFMQAGTREASASINARTMSSPSGFALARREVIKQDLED